MGGTRTNKDKIEHSHHTVAGEQQVNHRIAGRTQSRSTRCNEGITTKNNKQNPDRSSAFNDRLEPNEGLKRKETKERRQKKGDKRKEKRERRKNKGEKIRRKIKEKK